MTEVEQIPDNFSLLKAISDGTSDAVYAKDLRGRYLFLNKAAEQFVGKTAAEVLGRDDASIFPFAAAMAVMERDQQVIREGVVRTYEEDLILFSGQRAVFQSSKGPIFDANQKVVGLFGISRDITQYKRMEEKLEALRHEFDVSAARHSAMISGISDVIGIIRADGIMTYKSPNITKWFGWQPEDLVGTDGWLTVHPDDLDRLQRQFMTLLEQDHASVMVEFRYKCKDGSYKPVELTATNLTKDPDIHGVLLNYHDITERKRAEEDRRGKDLQFRKLSANVPDLIYQFTRRPDGSYYVPIASEGIKNIFGCSPDDVLADFAPIGRVLFPDDAARVIRDIEYSASHLSLFTCEFRVQIPGKPIQWLLSRSTPERLEDGSVTWYGFNADITQRKQAEEREKELHWKMERAARMESVGRLAGGVAHDFNNLLMGTLAYADLARNELPADHPACDCLDEITRIAQRSAALTRQLLAFARKQIIVPQVLDLNDTLSEMLKLLRRLLGENIQIVWRPGTNLAPVKLDPSQIDQVLTNLCINARDAITGVGAITIQTAAATLDQAFCVDHEGTVPGEYIRLMDSDTGCGMTKDVVANIFEPFYTTKDAGKGVGLGLSTVYGIVKQNKGAIHVTSEPGKGTTFQIYLPRFAGEVGQATGDTAAELPRGQGETLLIVEDEKTIGTALSLCMRAIGYKVLLAENPADALGQVARHAGDIHLLLTDVVMPGMNGRDMANQLLAQKPGLKVIYMSGYSADVLAKDGLLVDGMHFVQKPATRAELARKVHELLA